MILDPGGPRNHCPQIGWPLWSEPSSRSFGFWTIVLGARDATERAGRTMLVLAGLVLLVLSFMGLVAVSRAPRPWSRTARAVALALEVFVVTLAASAIADQIMPLAAVIVIALGIGGTAALANHGADVVGDRLWAVVVVAGITWGLLLIAEELGVVAATILPFLGLVIADMAADKSL